MSLGSSSNLNFILRAVAASVLIGVIIFTSVLKTDRQSPLQEIDSDIFIWSDRDLLLRDMLLDWKGMLGPCVNDMNYSGVSKKNMTDTTTSYISSWNIHGVGEMSWFTLQTQTKAGEPLSEGGDTWIVDVTGTMSLYVAVWDNNNGSYTFYFIPQLSGEYRLILVLEYSRCEGHMDPPTGYFAAGNIHGSNQRPDTLGTRSRAYQHSALWEGTPLVILITNSTRHSKELPRAQGHSLMLNQSASSLKCNYILEPFGTWHLEKWVALQSQHNKLELAKLSKRSWLWIYGDSLALRFYASLVHEPLCTEIFRCNRSYNWVYRFESYDDKFKTSHEDFHAERVLQDLGEVLKLDIMDENSAILINFGLHFVSSLSFSEYQDFIYKLVAYIKDAKMTGIFTGTVIWKTTTHNLQEKLWNPFHDARRFLTSIRVKLFNAFATSVMCDAGIPIVDVYPLSASYPDGTESAHDSLHYGPKVFRPLIDRLTEYFAIDYSKTLF